MGVDRIWVTSVISVRASAYTVYRTNSLCHIRQQIEKRT